MKDLLFALCDACSIGTVKDAGEIAKKELAKYAEIISDDGNIVAVKRSAEPKKSVMIEAHIDEVGFVVTDVDENGFLSLSKCGGIDLKTLPATRVRVHGKKTVDCCFCSVPPHLSEDKEAFENINEFKIDSLQSKTAKDIISVGDFVTYATTPAALLGDRVTAKSLDDRAGVACVIELAKRLKDAVLPFDLYFVLSDMEELGTRGARTAAFDVTPDEAVCIDVSFGDGENINDTECGNLGGGAMVGVSPALSGEISDTLLAVARRHNIPYQTEIMSGTTGTDADVVSLTKGGVRTGLLSIPLRNMHTANEIVDLNDLISVCDILEQYLLSGGAKI